MILHVGFRHLIEYTTSIRLVWSGDVFLYSNKSLITTVMVAHLVRMVDTEAKFTIPIHSESVEDNSLMITFALLFCIEEGEQTVIYETMDLSS